MAHSNPSICIPRMFPNQTKEMVFAVFKQLNLGEIDRIDLVKRKQDGGKETMRGFIHFKQWFDNEGAQSVLSKFEESDQTKQSFKVQYHDKWYWICTKSRIAKPKHEGARPTNTRTAPRLVLDMSSSDDAAPSTPPAEVAASDGGASPKQGE